MSLPLMPATVPLPSSVEAKVVILGAQGVGKTSLVCRLIDPAAPLEHHPSTVGASFVTKKVHDADTNTTIRLQIWDTAGQERFRSISRLYYRGANVGLLCYDITSEQSWEDMKGWLRELRENCGTVDNMAGEELIIHVVGTKNDLVAQDPSRRAVPFERTIAYVAEELFPSQASTPPLTMRQPATSLLANWQSHSQAQSQISSHSPPSQHIPSALANSNSNANSKRSSGFWAQDLGWDSCHEVSAMDGEGIDEMFRVIARKLVDQRNRREQLEQEALAASAAASRRLDARGRRDGPGGGYSDYSGPRGAGNRAAGDYANNPRGSFRLGYGDKRRSWMSLPALGALDLLGGEGSQLTEHDVEEARRKGRCC